MGKIENLLARLAKKDPAAVQELQAELNLQKSRREYGLVFEPHEAEGVRMPGRTIRKGDNVHVLPPRGEMDTAENYKVWTVLKIDKSAGTAHLLEAEPENEDEPPIEQDIALDDLVVYAQFDEDIFPGLVETGRVMNGDPDQPPQIVINGENYHALEAMLWCYQGKVDCIYIDPPYNSRNKTWKYNNNYVDNNDAYADSKWLALMEARLLLAKQLLNPEKSVLIATIDEKEYLPLGMLLKQTFPEARMQMISSVINTGGSVRDGAFSRTDEYLYMLMFGKMKVLPLPLTNDWSSSTTSDKKVEPVLWRSMKRGGEAERRIDREHMFYPIYVYPDGRGIHSVGDPLPLTQDRHTVVPPQGTVAVFPMLKANEEGRWRVGVEKARYCFEHGYMKANYRKNDITISYLADGVVKSIDSGKIIITGKKSDGSVILQSHEEHTIAAGTSWNIQSHNATSYGTKMNSTLMPDRKFPYPKSLYAVEDCLRFFIADMPNALIMDFFSGSGTTCHATMRLNKQDGGHRQCIAITNNEMSEEEEEELILRGYRPGDEEWERNGVCNLITKPRIEAAITGIDTLGSPIQGDYGIMVDEYVEIIPEDDNAMIVNAKTQKPLKKKFYQKVKKQSKVVPDPFPIADGFKENAIFFDLVYNAKGRVEMGLEFENIAPLLWLKAGGSGEMITEEADEGFAISKNYAILFDSDYATQLIEAIQGNNDIAIVYIIEDEERIYQQIARLLPNTATPQRLYEPYIRAFASYTR